MRGNVLERNEGTVLPNYLNQSGPGVTNFLGVGVGGEAGQKGRGPAGCLGNSRYE